VYAADYDMAPLIEPLQKMLKDNGAKELAKMPAGKDHDELAQVLKDGLHAKVTEVFSNIQVNVPVATKEFDTAFPKGVSTATPPPPPAQDEQEPKPPVPIGHLAPEFSVTGMDGKKLKLSSLRGHVVMIDFWATWCPPCRETLPETYRLSKVGEPRGLKVLPISDEDHGTGAGFLKQNHYARPTFLDKGSKAEKTYNIQAIPTVVIIDAKGKLRNYFVGAQDPKTLKDALLKAGVKVP
jgi:thiol-disulfide isomerase/thioredoxin